MFCCNPFQISGSIPLETNLVLYLWIFPSALIFTLKIQLLHKCFAVRGSTVSVLVLFSWRNFISSFSIFWLCFLVIFLFSQDVGSSMLWWWLMHMVTKGHLAIPANFFLLWQGLDVLWIIVIHLCVVVQYVALKISPDEVCVLAKHVEVKLLHEHSI